MTDTRITDYDILMKGENRSLFVYISPTRLRIVDRIRDNPAISNHVATKVAYCGNTVAGWANIFLHKALNGNANLGFYVHPSMRRQGIATMLSREAIKDARSKGITVLYIRTHKDNFATVAVARDLDFTHDNSRFAEEGLAVFVKQL
jgi:GNAT superfamily N-acetyltransferase